MDHASIAAGICVLLILFNLSSIVLAQLRVSKSPSLPSRHDGPAVSTAVSPAVSIVIPLRGVEPFTTETLERSFTLAWREYELLFCVADARDPVVPMVRSAMALHPHVPARLLVADDRVCSNPKLNNCVKGWRAARHDWVILADSNVLMPPDYVGRLMAARKPGTGLVCSMPLGTRPGGFWAEVECAWLNTFQARWQYATEAIGNGFAQGKSMLWRKDLLDANGGIEALGEEIAEDAASTKLIRRLGLAVNLVDAPFEQPLGSRTLSDIWSRQARWARLRRVTFPVHFAPELLVGAMPAMLFAGLAGVLSGAGIAPVVALVAIAFYVPEYGLAKAKGWPAGPRYVAAMIVRDVMLPAVWLRGWLGSNIEWRGNAMVIRPGAETMEHINA